MARLDGKVIVITGGARGIGGATAIECARSGAKVVIGDLLEQEAAQTLQAVRAAGGEGLFVRTDVTQEDDCRRLMDAAVEAYGKIDAVITCAGILKGAYTDVDQLNAEIFDQVMQVNVRGTFLAVKHAVRHMRRQGRGVVLCIASGAGVRGPSSSLAYGASKGGVNGFVMTLEPQLARMGIRCHAVCPGNLATPLKLENVADGARARGESPEEAVARARETLGDPAGVGRILTWLCSDDADYMRGNIFTR
jgi:NAD(P)-dependent dehydrogenase (short-subunit alcohol dehydrogenase family)